MPSPIKEVELLDSERGFTLIELLVTLAILAIVVSLAAPSFREWRERIEALRVKSILFSALKQAKSQSYGTQNDVLFCLSDGAGRCHRNSSKKLLLFVDRNSNKHFDSHIDHLILNENTHLRYGALSLGAGSRRHYAKFYSDTGRPRGHMGHIKYCPNSGDTKNMFQVSFNKFGIIKYKPNAIHRTGCSR
jgi:type IV fimbrial biogenesis protein FimT